MRTTLRSLAGTVLAGAALATTSLAALAVPAHAGAQHAVFPEEYDDTWTMDADENMCGPWPATLHEVRTGSYRIVAAPGGQVDGEFHVNGVINGLIELDPDADGPLPTYTGTYREKVNGVIYSEDGEDAERVAQFRLRTVARADDGSTLKLVLSGKVTVNAKGRVASQREVASCVIA